MKILVIGGTGTISHGIATRAIEKGHEVYVLNRGNHEFRTPKGAIVFKGDIYDKKFMTGLLTNNFFDIVVDPISYDVDSLKMKTRLFNGKCSKYVFISSVAALGNADYEIDETIDMKPKWSYGKNKLACEQFLASNKFSFSYLIIRPSITYGDIRIPIPVSSRKNPYAVIDRIKSNKPLVCFEFSKNQNLHKLMHISDFSFYAVELIDNDQISNDDFNICSNNSYSWNEIYDLLYKTLGIEKHLYEIDRDKFKHIDYSLYEDILYDKGSDKALYSRRKITKKLGIDINEIKIEDGIKSLVQYLESNYIDCDDIDNFNLTQDALILFELDNKDKYLKDYVNSLTKEYIERVALFYNELLNQNKRIFKKNNSMIAKIKRFLKKILR